MTTWLIFKTKAIADALLQEVAVTPTGVIFYCSQPSPNFGFDNSPNIMGFVTSSDGRVAIGHPLDEVDIDFFEAWFSDEIVAGNVTITQTFPSDWEEAEV